MKKLGNKYPNVYFRKKGKGTFLHTKNLYDSNFFNEKIVKEGNDSYRYWDPSRSKLAAAILNDVSQIALKEGDVVLYLGSGHGYTPTYVSDIVGRDGMVFCLDFAPRVVRDLVFVCEERENMAPLLADANKPESYSELVPEQVDVIFQDISQKNQVEIFLKNVNEYLKDGGFGLLALKAHSIDSNRKPSEIFDEVRKELEKEMVVADYRSLEPFEKGHALFVCKKK